MAQPTPEPIPTGKLRELALDVIRADKFPILATDDHGQPRARPVSPVRSDDFTIYIANLRSYHKTQEIEANARVELVYIDDKHDQVRLTGNAEVVRDRDVLESIWESAPLLRQYLRDIDNPEFILYRVRPNRVRFMREWALNYHEVPLD